MIVNNQRNQIYVYERNKPSIYSSIAKKVSCEEDYYAFRNQDGAIDNITVEKWLGDLEHKTSFIIKKVEDGIRLTLDDKRNLSEFISVFWRRVPYHKVEHDKKMTELLPIYFSRIYEELRILGIKEENPKVTELRRIEQQYEEEIPSSFYSQNIMRDSEITKAILAMDWVFIKAPKDTPFVTCDNPFVFERGAGIGNSQHGHIIFPISKSVVLQAAQFTHFNGYYQQIKDTLARDINKRIVGNAYLKVYSSFKSKYFAQFVDNWIGSDLPQI